MSGITGGNLVANLHCAECAKHIQSGNALRASLQTGDALYWCSTSCLKRMTNRCKGDFTLIPTGKML